MLLVAVALSFILSRSLVAATDSLVNATAPDTVGPPHNIVCAWDFGGEGAKPDYDDCSRVVARIPRGAFLPRFLRDLSCVAGIETPFFSSSAFVGAMLILYRSVDRPREAIRRNFYSRPEHRSSSMPNFLLPWQKTVGRTTVTAWHSTILSIHCRNMYGSDSNPRAIHQFSPRHRGLDRYLGSGAYNIATMRAGTELRRSDCSER